MPNLLIFIKLHLDTFLLIKKFEIKISNKDKVELSSFGLFNSLILLFYRNSKGKNVY